MPELEQRTAEAWASVTSGSQTTPELLVLGGPGGLPSALATEEVAVSCVSVALMTAAASQARRIGRPVKCFLNRAHVAEAMQSERRFTVDGRPAGMGFAPLSTFWRTVDGWVRTHANYPWHRAALLSALGVRDGGDSDVTREMLTSVMAELPAQDIEDRVFGQGGVAVRVRNVSEWAETEQGMAVAQDELVGHQVFNGASPRLRGTAERPAGGVRVLDLTRVIAGPVGSRYLGALGASVLRLDAPERLDMARGQVADTLLGKRTAELDFTTTTGLDSLHELLDTADVVVSGYRPSSLDRFGLTDEELAERHPGLVVVRLSAWGHTGPWATRRGFDSVVQAATGISHAEADGQRPGALPCQLLDHGVGYLAAAAAMDGLHRQETEGGTQVRTLSLARMAQWLTDSTPSATSATPATEEGQALAHLESDHGEVVGVAPPGQIGGRPLRWPVRVSGYLDDEPEWPQNG